MPIKGFHDATTGRNYTLDRLDEVRSWEPTILRDIARRENEDERHSGTNLTVTCGLGCPRKLGIQRFMDTFPDPQRLIGMTMGTYIHKQFEGLYKGEPGWRVEVEYKGRLFGHGTSCKADREHTTGDVVDVISDWKTSMAGADQWVSADRRAEPHHTAQLNANRLLAVQSGVNVAPNVTLEAVVVSKTLQKTYAPVMGEEEIGALVIGSTKQGAKDGARQWTFKELTNMAAGLFEYVKSVDSDPAQVKDYVAKMSLNPGLDMWRSRAGDNACSSCSVRRECGSLSGHV